MLDRKSFVPAHRRSAPGAAFLAVAAALFVAGAAFAQTGTPPPGQPTSPPPGFPASYQAPPPPAKPGPEIMPTFGWQWGGTIDYTDTYGYYGGGVGDIHINAAPTYGGTLTVPVRPGYWGEISYWYQGAEVRARPAHGQDFKLFDLATHYVQFSGLRALRPPSGKAVPYVMGGLGFTVFDPGSSQFQDYNTQWLFSLSAGGGVRIDMNEKMALRLQARLLLPVNWVSGGFYFGTGGSGVSISGGSSLPQGDATLGLVFKLGKK